MKAVSIGDVFDLVWKGRRRRCTCQSINDDGTVVLLEQASEWAIEVRYEDFERMMVEERIIFIDRDNLEADRSTSADFISLARPRRSANTAEMLRAMVVRRLIATIYDNVPGISLSDKGVQTVNHILGPILSRRNLPYIHLTTQKLRRIVARGEPGYRPLHLYCDRRFTYDGRTRKPTRNPPVGAGTE